MSDLDFDTRRDPAYVVAMIGGAALGIVVTTSALAAPAPLPVRLALPFVLLAGIVLPLWVLISTGYTLTADELRIRSGPFRWRIPIASIQAIAPSRNTRSSPALSLDRLQITYGAGRWVLVSPVTPSVFLHELKARRPPHSAPL